VKYKKTPLRKKEKPQEIAQENEYIYIYRFFFLLFRSHHHSSNSLRQHTEENKNHNKNKNKNHEIFPFSLYKVLAFYISALIRSDVEIVDGRILTFGVTKSPSFPLPDGECDDGGTTAAVG